MNKMKTLTVDLDDNWPVEYFYTKYDIGGAGHSITIKEEDREKFLDAMAKEFREYISDGLVETEEDEEDEE